MICVPYFLLAVIGLFVVAGGLWAWNVITLVLDDIDKDGGVS